MLMKRSTVVTIILSLSASIAWLVIVQHRRDVREKRDRELRERSYAAALATYAAELRPGMTREAAHQYLRSHHVAYITRGIGADSDDLIRLAREPSQQWYCSWLDVSVAVSYTEMNRPDPRPEDRIQKVNLDRWLQDCM